MWRDEPPDDDELPLPPAAAAEVAIGIGGSGLLWPDELGEPALTPDEAVDGGCDEGAGRSRVEIAFSISRRK